MSIESCSAERIKLDIYRVHEATSQVIGQDRLSWLEHCNSSVMQHGFGTGEIMWQILEDYGYPEEICRCGALTGALHDVGKLAPELYEYTNSVETFSIPEREYFTKAHSSRGYEMLTELAMELQSQELDLSAFSALEHHSQPPDGYRNFTPHLAFAWGMTHLLHLGDMIQALHFDVTRLYVAKREGGELTVEDKMRIILGNCYGDPVIDGNRISIEAEVQRFLLA